MLHPCENCYWCLRQETNNQNVEPPSVGTHVASTVRVLLPGGKQGTGTVGGLGMMRWLVVPRREFKCCHGITFQSGIYNPMTFTVFQIRTPSVHLILRRQHRFWFA